MVDTSFASRLIATASAAIGRAAGEFGAIAGLDTPMCVADASAPDMPITYANPAFLALTGYGREETVGRNCRFLQGPETQAADVESFRRGLELRRPFQVELTNYRKDGTPFRNKVFISPLRDAEGRVTHFLGMQVPLGLPAVRSIEAEHSGPHPQTLQLLQTLTSLLSLHARRARSEEGRRELENMMARFEAIGAAQHAVARGADMQGYLSLLVPRIALLFDPLRDIRMHTSLVQMEVSDTRLSLIGQIVAELMIAAFERARRAAESARVDVTTEAGEDGTLMLEVACRALSGRAPALSGAPDTGVFEAEMAAALVNGLGGTLERAADNGFAARARIPPE